MVARVGDRGGKVVAAGTPEEVAKIARSHTGKYLAKVLAGGWKPTKIRKAARAGAR